MSGLQVERPGSARWASVWESTGREPFAHPAFGRLFAAADEECVAVCWEDDRGQVLLPLVLRALPSAVSARLDQGSGRPWRDVTSPYGYGGPFLAGQPDLASFWRALLDWMREAHLLSGFIRASVVSPARTAAEPDGVRSVHLADNVVVGLDLDADGRWRRYEHKVRKNVNKARRHGLSTVVAPTFDDVTGFVDVYAGTMDRRSAASFYRFDEDFFRRLAADLPTSFWVADTRDEEGHLVSTELVLVGDRHCYSFLGGTLREAFAMAPNDLLKHDVIEHAAASGLAAYVLGGGYTPDDGIFRYKRSFDPTGVVPFAAIQLVGDEARYDRACAEADADADARFFPRYRAPVA